MIVIRPSACFIVLLQIQWISHCMFSIGFGRSLQAPRTLNLAEPLQNFHSLRLLARMVLVDAPNGRQCCMKMLALTGSVGLCDIDLCCLFICSSMICCYLINWLIRRLLLEQNCEKIRKVLKCVVFFFEFEEFRQMNPQKRNAMQWSTQRTVRIKLTSTQ